MSYLFINNPLSGSEGLLKVRQGEEKSVVSDVSMAFEHPFLDTHDEINVLGKDKQPLNEYLVWSLVQSKTST